MQLLCNALPSPTRLQNFAAATGRELLSPWQDLPARVADKHSDPSYSELSRAQSGSSGLWLQSLDELCISCPPAEGALYLPSAAA
jgi:hypothetical protein